MLARYMLSSCVCLSVRHKPALHQTAKRRITYCLILNIVYILSYPTIETVKQESHSGTADNYILPHIETNLFKNILKPMFVFIHLT